MTRRLHTFALALTLLAATVAQAAKFQIVRGSTSVILHVFALDSTSTVGAGKAALGFGDFACRYVRNGETISGAITAQDIAVLGTYATPTANTNIRIKLVDDTNMAGVYEVQLHDDWVNATNTCRSLIIYLTATGMAPLPIEIELTGVNLQDGVRGGMTALPNVAAGAAGGLPDDTDANGRVRIVDGTGAGEIDTTSGRVGITGLVDASAAKLDDILDGTGGTGLTLSSVVINNAGGAGLTIIGSTFGILVAGGTSRGLDISSTGCDAVRLTAGANGHGLFAYGSGSGHGVRAIAGPTGHGLQVSGGATSGHGIFALANPTGSGHGIYARAYGAGNSGIYASAGAFSNGYGMYLAGNGTGSGLYAKGGTTGHGIYAYGGATSGDGFHAEAQTLGDGIEATGAGALMYDINADIHGTIDTVTTCTDQRGTDAAALAATALSTAQWTNARAGYLDNLNGHTAQTGDTFALANGASGFVATKADTAAILADTGTTGVVVSDLTAAALAEFFTTNSGSTYAASVAGSVVKEIADNAGGGAGSWTAAQIANILSWSEKTFGIVQGGR